ncbi:coiled-coil domain-containing protein 189-like isoform X1 [Selaginella moellendorffii]|uniref:coiled-coil domain-containing protein 189-like isoform X1 n=1 Tax=Selaginella moellendorffii TaxID=88036 RepID=UPI000D1C9406|nr:coiled-coil domain-containing protein 189-like isoform X1 [Selaginella moellendorffii]|eukprot:XP_024518578.1 coiled-coil domain-containing protein 189-like isoform X1 [Selaginella moellendorffii]
MAECLAWRDLSHKELAHIFDDSETPSDVRRHLGEAMKLNDGSICSEILLDLHYGSLYFAQEQGFSLEKMSAFVSIVKAIHDQAIGMRLTVERSWETAKNLFLLHSVQRPPFSIGLFTFGDLQEITRYVLNT